MGLRGDKKCSQWAPNKDLKLRLLRSVAVVDRRCGYPNDSRCLEAMKVFLLAALTLVLAACSGESLSPERKACLEKASTEAERIECNKESAIEADKKAEDADSKTDEAN